MKKKTINKFGKHYLLGQLNNGQYLWLETPSWDCGWYWGGLYLHTYTNNRQPTRSVDIDSHTHFDTRFLNKGHDFFNESFIETTLTEYESWRLYELANTFYILAKSAGLFEQGSSWVSKNDCYDVIKDQKLYEEIVKVKIPAVVSAICNLLGGNTTPDEFAKMVIIKD